MTHPTPSIVFDSVSSDDRTSNGVRPPWYRSLGTFVLWFVLHAVSILPRNAMAMLAGAQLEPIMPPLVGIVYNLLLAAGFIWWFARRGGPEASYRETTFQTRSVPSAVVARLPLVAVPLVATVFLSLIVVPRFIPFPPHKADPLEAFLKMRFGIAAVLSLVSLVVPLCEEFLFRGWLQTTLQRWLKPTQAIVLTALIFGVVHGQTFGLPIRVIFGLASGYLIWSTRSIWPSVVLHGIYNAVLVGGGEATPGIDDAVLTRWAHTPSIFLPAVAGFVFSALLLVVALRYVALAARRTEVAPA